MGKLKYFFFIFQRIVRKMEKQFIKIFVSSSVNVNLTQVDQNDLPRILLKQSQIKQTYACGTAPSPRPNRNLKVTSQMMLGENALSTP